MHICQGSFWFIKTFLPVGRVHGFTELNGVPFKIADKYDIVAAHSEITSLVENLQISSPANALVEAASYTFDLERRVIQNMEAKKLQRKGSKQNMKYRLYSKTQGSPAFLHLLIDRMYSPERALGSDKAPSITSYGDGACSP
ncbi:hypothetical protein RRG08_003295 [Elysia crispata]|uniref:UMA domain-containing protein n=1 Tax=Elysia crispata TaxID=231223 RepID=A0AAE1B993_9GAST|nr:hypothetical protein RRG08_003295 [Elysia crispata]